MKKNTKLVIVTPSLPPEKGGGIAAVHHGLFKILQKGYEVHAIAYQEKNYHKSSRNIFRIKTPPKPFGILLQKINNAFFSLINGRRNAYHTVNILKNIPNKFRISRALRNIQPDIIITPDHGLPLLFVKIPKKSRVVHLTHHNPARFEDIEEIKPSHLDIKFATLMERKFLKKVDHIVAPSKYMKDFFQKTHPNFGNNVSVIHNPVGVSVNKTLDVRREIRNANQETRIIYIPSATLSIKGKSYLIEFIKKLNAKIDNIGFFITGKISPEFVDKIEAAADNKVFLPGTIKRTKLLSYLSSCDLCASITLLESFGMAQAEALLSGIPVVAFDAGGNRALRSLGTIRLIKNKDLDELVKAAGKALEEGREIIRDSKKTNNYQEVAKKYDSLLSSIQK